MKIETKFNTSQEVWFMKDNKPAYSDVVKIEIVIEEISGAFGSNQVDDIYYELKNGMTRIETTIFATKQDLLNSL